MPNAQLIPHLPHQTLNYLLQHTAFFSFEFSKNLKFVLHNCRHCSTCTSLSFLINFYLSIVALQCCVSFFILFYYYFLFMYVFIYLWLCWVFGSVRGLSLVAASGGHSSSRCAGLSLSPPLLLRSYYIFLYELFVRFHLYLNQKSF